MKRIALILVLGLMAGVSLAQSTYLNPVPGHRHIYTAIFQKGDYPTRWYVATDPEGTRAPYNSAYSFDELTAGVTYDPSIDALTGRDLMAVSIRWGETLNEGEIYYVFVEVESKGCTNRMAMKVIIAKDNTPQNLPPVAVTDYAATNFGEPVCINLLRNDFDLDNDTIFLANVYQPGSGALISYAGTDSICYTPPTGYVGTDTLIYRICDSGTPSLCDADTLFVTVLDPIVARPDYAELYAGDQTSLALLPNDTFQAPVVPSVIEDPKHGRYTLSPDGVLTYLADPDYMGNDTLIYLIRNAGGADTALVVLQIKPLVSLTASPFCNNGEPWFWWETTARGFVPKSVGLKLYDLNGNLVHEMAAAPLSGSMAWPGEFSKSSPLPPAELTTISIDILFGEVPQVGVQSTRINYPNCTQNIVVAVADTATIFGIPTILNVLANDYDPDEGEIDTLSVALHRDSISQGPYHGHLTFNSDGTLTYTPDLVYNGLDSFVYRICDDFSPTACDTAIVRLTLWYNAPIVARTDYETIYMGQTAIIDILDNDTDPEGKIDIVSIDLLVDPENGNAIINSDGTITYQPLTGFTGTDSLLYTVCDSGIPRTCDTAWVYIHVKQNENIIANRDNIETFSGNPKTFDPIINDFDPEGEIDTISLQIISTHNPKNGTALVNDGAIMYIPDQGFAGLDSFVYRLCDLGDPVSCDTAIVYINVINNNLGIVANPDLAYAIDWEPVTIKILSNDYDPDTISSIDPSTLALTLQP